MGPFEWYIQRVGVSMFWLFLSCTHTASELMEDVRITWLGVTSFVVQYDDKTILLDAFFSRPKLGQEEGSSEQGRLDFIRTMSTLGIDSLDAILIGHAHYDHAIDVGMVSLETGAPIYASATTCWIAKAQGVESEQCNEVQQGDRFSIGSLNVDVGRTIHWWPQQSGIGGAYGVLEEEPDPEHLFIVPHGGVLSFLMTFTEEENHPSILFQDSLGAIDADDGSHENYRENLEKMLHNQDPPSVWMTCVDCADDKETFDEYMGIISPRIVFSMHFDGLNPILEDGLQESFQEPEWYAQSLQDGGAISVYPEYYFQSYILKDNQLKTIP